MLLLAVLLIVVLGLAHSVLGERYILIRLFRRTDLPKIFGSTDFTVRTLRFAWHITTVAWFGLAALVFAASQGEISSQSVLRICKGYGTIDDCWCNQDELELTTQYLVSAIERSSDLVRLTRGPAKAHR